MICQLLTMFYISCPTISNNEISCILYCAACYGVFVIEQFEEM